MKNDEAIKTDVYRVIAASELSRIVTGVVSKTKRPHGSKNEDIVISLLANENGQIQTASVNVNIYVADNLISGQYEEDTIRCSYLATTAAYLFEVFSGTDFRARLLSQRVLAVEGAAEHIINNRIEYKQVNEK